MFISVVIPTYNRNDMLSNCLERLAPERQTIDASRYEVIVSDDSKTNIAAQLADSFPWAKILPGPKKGPAANRNNGASHAKGDWLVFIDDDCLPDPGILEAYYNEMQRGEYKALEGLTDVDRPRERFNEEAPYNVTGGYFWSCNIAVEKQLFHTIGGFDEGFPYPAMEDIDFFNRLKQVAEYKFIPEARLVHPWRIVKPFHAFRKRLLSNIYSLRKGKVKKNLAYRYKRLKLFVGLMISDFRTLRKCKFRGIGVFFDHVCFEIVMLFV